MKTLRAFFVGPAYLDNINSKIAATKWLEKEDLQIFITDRIENCDFVYFYQVLNPNPTCYNEIPHPKAEMPASIEKTKIDNGCLKLAIKSKKPILAISAGSIYACLAANGKVIQFTPHHSVAAGHEATDLEGNVYKIPSSHTVLMYPYSLKKHHFEVLLYSTEKSFKKDYSKHRIFETEERLPFVHRKVLIENNSLFKEPEAIWFSKIKTLAIQFNPAPFYYAQGNDKKVMVFLRETFLNKLQNINIKI
jgi:gamma-glutamyl-gamma-aminobutyrate hydrolase PuuD